MKKLAIFLALVVLMTAFALPTAAKGRLAYVTAIGGSPETLNFNNFAIPDENGCNDYAYNNVNAPYYGPMGGLNANIRVMYDLDHLYIRMHFSAAKKPTAVNVWLMENGNKFHYGITWDRFAEEFVINEAPHWAAQLGEVTAFKVDYYDDGTTLVDLVLSPTVMLVEGDELQMDIAASDGTSSYSWANTADGECYLNGSPDHFGTLTLGAARTPDGGTPGYDLLTEDTSEATTTTEADTTDADTTDAGTADDDTTTSADTTDADTTKAPATTDLAEKNNVLPIIVIAVVAVVVLAVVVVVASKKKKK